MVKITVYKNVEKEEVDKEKKENLPDVKTILVETEENPVDPPGPARVRRRRVANKTFCLVITFLLIVLCIFLLMVLIPRLLLKGERDEWFECGVQVDMEEEPQMLPQKGNDVVTSGPEIPRSRHPNHHRHDDFNHHKWGHHNKDDNDRHHKNHRFDIDDDLPKKAATGRPTTPISSRPLMLLKESFKVDVIGETELVRVPEFDNNHPVEVLHDFRAELTAYRDLVDNYCYVMDLDVTAVLPPQSLWDLVHKLQDGYYMPKTEVLEKTMRVVGPPVEDLRQFGGNVAALCSGLDTYKLEDVADIHPSLVKRDLSEWLNKYNKYYVEGIKLLEWTGRKMLKIVIVNLEEKNQE